MFTYPSIRQFRDVVRALEFDGVTGEVLFYKSTKLHGSNCSVVLNLENYEISCQSRNKKLKVGDDLNGFAQFVENNKDRFLSIFNDFLVLSVKPIPEGTKNLVLYGEWCGKGISKGVAISALEKMFVIFDLGFVIDGKEDVLLDSMFFINAGRVLQSEGDIHSIHNFTTPQYLDFTDPLKLQKELYKDVEEVERECPVGKNFGVSGVGEGLVYTSSCGKYKFKVKGESHKVSDTKYHTEEEVEALRNVRNFVSSVLKEGRLTQGVTYLEEMGFDTSVKNTGKFIMWVNADIMKEEGDLITELGLDPVKVNKEVSRISRDYFKKLN